jgi:hypothetical protein
MLRAAAIMGNSEELYCADGFAIDDVVREALERNPTEFGLGNDAIPLGSCASSERGLLESGVIPGTQPG